MASYQAVVVPGPTRAISVNIGSYCRLRSSATVAFAGPARGLGPISRTRLSWAFGGRISRQLSLERLGPSPEMSGPVYDKQVYHSRIALAAQSGQCW